MSDSSYNIAQINIAKLRYPITDPRIKDFVNNLDRINILADSSHGFIWRLKDETGNATSIQIFHDDLLIVNMSVWDTIENLFTFTYKSDHIDVFRRRGEWFTIMEKPHLALWWIKKGILPSAEEGKKKLEYIDKHGPTPNSFSFKKQFSASEFENFLNYNS